MEKPIALIIANENRYFGADILSQPAYLYIKNAIEQTGAICFVSGIESTQDNFIDGDTQSALTAFLQKCHGRSGVLLFFEPTVAITPDTVEKLCSGGDARLLCGDKTVAMYLSPEKAERYQKGAVPEVDSTYELAPEQSATPESAEGLYTLHEIMRRKINFGHMQNGVIIPDPSAVHISPAVHIEAGTIIRPGCQIFGDTKIASGCDIGPNALLQNAVLGTNVKVNASHIYDSTVKSGANIGPFAHIRPGCIVGGGARIGNFVELKNTTLGQDTKVSHLTYLGDSEVGSDVNIACGVVTVNYDGKKKYKTKIGSGSFVGCNTNLVAPVNVGEQAYIAAGSTITEDVPKEALAIARCRQQNKPDWVKSRKNSGKL